MRRSLHATLLATVVLIAQPVWGHHSTSAIFENDKRITVTGTLTKVDWINPHIVDLPRVAARLGSGDVEDSGQSARLVEDCRRGPRRLRKGIGTERDRRSAAGAGRLALRISPSNSVCQRRQLSNR